LKTTDANWSETPLWLYVLAESKAQRNGQCLGEVGGRIVAEVIIELIRHDPTSFMSKPNWRPELATHDGGFGIADLLKLAGMA